MATVGKHRCRNTLPSNLAQLSFPFMVNDNDAMKKIEHRAAPPLEVGGNAEWSSQPRGAAKSKRDAEVGEESSVDAPGRMDDPA